MAVGAAGVGVLAATVVMLPGVEAKFVTVNVNGPPKEPAVVFCNANVGGFGALLNVQTIFANGFRLTTGTVMTLPASVPKLAGLPVVPELVSVQLPLDNVKLLLAASVRVTGLAMLVTEIELGAAGAAVPAVMVVMLAGAPAKLVAEKLNGPPATTVVIFCMATKGMAGFTMLVNVQVIWALARILVAGIVRTVPASVPNVPTGLPDAAALPSEQLADVIEKFVATVSVIVTAVPVALARIGVVTVG